MIEHSEPMARLRMALDAPLQRLGYVVAKRPGDSVTYAVPRCKEVLIAVSLRMSAGDAIDGVYVVDPLLKPDGVRLLMPIFPAEGRSGAAPTRRLGSSGWSGEDVARVIDSGLKRLRRQYGDARSFAENTDDEYLSDEAPELAEAVAYMYFRAGLVDTAMCPPP